MTYRNLPDKSHPNAKQMKPIVGVDIHDDPHGRNVSPLPNAFDNNYARHSADGTRVSNGHPYGNIDVLRILMASIGNVSGGASPSPTIGSICSVLYINPKHEVFPTTVNR